jgi:hypothetical protein
VDAELKTASLLACLPPFSPTVSTSNFFPFQNRKKKKKKNVKIKKKKKKSKTFENQERIKNLENEQKRQTSKKKKQPADLSGKFPPFFARKENKKLLLV